VQREEEEEKGGGGGGGEGVLAQKSSIAQGCIFASLFPLPPYLNQIEAGGQRER
jgi:hypothetical protein